MGLFHPFLDDEGVEIYGVEAAGRGVDQGDGHHAASLSGGRPGVLHGNRTYLLQDGDGQIIDGHSISAGLDYPGIGPEHAWLHEVGRVNYEFKDVRQILEDDLFKAFLAKLQESDVLPEKKIEMRDVMIKAMTELKA